MNVIQTQVAVLGGGPGGYTAAFRAADLGLETLIIEKEERLGGVCLNVGCIPSKTLLHAADIIRSARDGEDLGIKFNSPEIDISKLKTHKDDIIKKLTSGLEGLCKLRNVRIIRGLGTFIDKKSIEVEVPGTGEKIIIQFENCIIAAGSRTVELPFLPVDDPRIWDSTRALDLSNIPKSLLILGGGIIGLEMAALYHELGSSITVVEMAEQIIPAADKDLVRILATEIKKRYNAVYTQAAVKSVDNSGKKLKVFIKGRKAPEFIEVDCLLSAVGRIPNSGLVGLENAGVNTDEKGFIKVNSRQETEVPGIFAVGDICGNPMLAHKATHQGKTAAEVIAGKHSAFTPMTIPSVAYTDPQVAWMGLTERDAAESGIEYTLGKFPWSASGRALSESSSKGISKVLFDKNTKRILGAGIVGKNAGELISEAVLALEMGADAEDISKTIHPHPTLSETFAFASEIVDGSITDLPQ